MKKFVSAVLAASLAVSTMGAVCSSAYEKYGDGMNIVVFGDSIAEGYDLSETQYNYGQIIADYLGGSVSNYAKAGAETTDTLNQIANASDLSDADVVIISSGANDMIHYSTRYMLQLCDSMGVLAEGYTADDIPETPTFQQMMEMIDIDGLKSFASKPTNQIALNKAILTLSANLTMTEGDTNYDKYERVIETQVMVNIEQMVSDIRAVNPDARIIVQTIYNPIQIQEDSLESSYQQMLTLLKPTFNSVIDSYRTQVMEIEDVEIADIYADFTSTDGYSWYFTDIQDSNGKEFKIHPNQAGHVAIAANILNVIGEKREDGGLLNLTYNKLGLKKIDYPAEALTKYKNVEGSYVLGCVNDDFAINATDATEILKVYTALATGENMTFSSEQQKAANLNKDEFIDSKDATLVLAYYAYVSTGGKGSLKNMLANE